jgi:FeS assembly SUF system regulator
MIRFSRLADYAILLMTHVAQAPGVHNAVDAARITGVPAPTASKVMARLAGRGLLTSLRGAKGGYVLARAAEGITVTEIVSALDGPIALTTCMKAGPSSCEIEPVCPSRISLGTINRAVERALNEISLAEIAQPSPLIAALRMPSAAQAPTAAQASVPGN